MIRVTISGIKRVEDAFSAIRWGADAIAVGVGQRSASVDFISVPAAYEILRPLPPFINRVLVTHYTTAAEVLPLVAALPVDTVQLQGEMKPAEIAALRRACPHLAVIKAFHIVDEACIEYGVPYCRHVDAFILDSVDVERGAIGGTGTVHDWQLARRVVARYPTPVVLAGGLHPGNVEKACEVVRPYAVSANSLLRSADGFKDHALLHHFIDAAKRAGQD